MGQRTLDILELPKILKRLARFASFSASQEMALSLTPSYDFDLVLLLQQQTEEARKLLDLKPNMSVATARDVRGVARRAALGGTLDPADLLEVSATLACGRVLAANLSRLGRQLPLLAQIAERIAIHEDVEQEIARCITPQGEVADNATPILRRLRSEVKIAHQRLMDRLESLVNASTLRQIIQEPIVTQREGRYVIPIKADFKGQFQGIVHGQSASGATVFVEPIETVDMNNRWRELQLEEQREVQRILRGLSAMVGAVSEDLGESVMALATIDLALAKAKYAVAMRASAPRLIRGEATAQEASRSVSDGKLFLKFINARHPLLGDEVVPITVDLGGDFFILVITGPNTGGKTVALKTVGLLTLMAQSGMQIPADEGSCLRVFNQVYADIGDEQGIEQSLSTFSSHVVRVIDVLKKADAGSLALLDELGAGTDPTEGSALARAILEYLIKRRVPTIATTHYSELKAYAHATEGVENACVEFDPETLAPSYRLTIGLPGRSNAIAIASRLGVPSQVVEWAVKHLDPSETQVDSLLAQIQGERGRIAEERSALERLMSEVEERKAALEERLSAVEKERQAVVERAWGEVYKEIEEVRRQLRAARLVAEREKPDKEAIAAALSDVEAAQVVVEMRSAAQPPQPTEPSLPQRELKAGDYVLIRSLNQDGQLVTAPDNRGEAEVQLGGFKVRVSARDLQRVKKPSVPTCYETSGTEIRLQERSTPPREIEIRMWRVEQVLPVLEQYINDAYLTGMPEVRVIHGKGTGVLRRVVREQLAQNPMVRSFRTADLRDGGEGVTVVELAL
ncbi:MAG: endonuclease MutS2 [Dehalococcoidales bacterium]|nr:endonuclease MutS2 [Dehalococcoidales bacterium]